MSSDIIVPGCQQALPQPNKTNMFFVEGEFDSKKVSNAYFMPSMHREVLFSATETPFNSNLVCPSGSPNVNNVCACSGNPSAVPYRQNNPARTADYMHTLFSPLEASMWPPMRPAAMALVQQRSPSANSYSSMCQ